MYKSLRIGRICVEANEEEIQEGKERKSSGGWVVFVFTSGNWKLQDE
jgi:hypothetical protein